MSSTSTLIIVNGASGTGKTHLSRRLAKALRLPLLSKDDIKEGLYDEFVDLGPNGYDIAWSQKIGGASFDALFNVIEQQLAAGIDCITETAFSPKFSTPKFLQLKEKYGYCPLQIFCYCEATALAERISQRQASGERHPVHWGGNPTVEMIQQHEASDKFGVLDVGGKLITIDLTDLEALDFEGLVEKVRAVLS